MREVNDEGRLLGSDHEVARELASLLVQWLREHLDLHGGPLVDQAQRDHAAMGATLSEDHLAEVLVADDEDAIFGQGARRDGDVGNRNYTATGLSGTNVEVSSAWVAKSKRARTSSCASPWYSERISAMD